MEPVSIMSTIFKLVKDIAKAASTARRNQARCSELARRADTVGNVLRASTAGAKRDAAPVRRSILCMLKEALDDALKLVESCRRRGGVVFWLCVIVTSGSKSAKFDDVDKRITTCLGDLNAANGVIMESKLDKLTARDRHPLTNKPKQNQVNAVNTPPKGGSKNGGRNNTGGQNRGKGGKRRKGKKTAAAARPPPPLSHAGVPSYPNVHGYAYAAHHHSIEEDPTSCSVM